MDALTNPSTVFIDAETELARVAARCFERRQGWLHDAAFAIPPMVRTRHVPDGGAAFAAAVGRLFGLPLWAAAGPGGDVRRIFAFDPWSLSAIDVRGRCPVEQVCRDLFDRDGCRVRPLSADEAAQVAATPLAEVREAYGAVARAVRCDRGPDGMAVLAAPSVERVTETAIDDDLADLGETAEACGVDLFAAFDGAGVEILEIRRRSRSRPGAGRLCLAAVAAVAARHGVAARLSAIGAIDGRPISLYEEVGYRLTGGCDERGFARMEYEPPVLRRRRLGDRSAVFAGLVADGRVSISGGRFEFGDERHARMAEALSFPMNAPEVRSAAAPRR